MTADPTGVALVARIFEALARDEDCTATSLARDLGAARATTYEVVRQLDRSGFLDRSASGRITPGAASAALGFAALGLGGLTGAAEALLPVLRDDTDASVELVVRHGDDDIVVMRRMAPGLHADVHRPAGAGVILEEAISARNDGPAAWLRLHLRADAAKPERTAAQACLKSVAEALSRSARS